jgi:prevent-host-death family protein
MYIIAVIALMYIMVLRYTADMTAPKKEHQERIADVRNSLAEAIEKARYYDETTVLTSRGKRVAVLVGMDFYERALEALGEERVRVVKDDEPVSGDEQPQKRRVVRVPKRSDD